MRSGTGALNPGATADIVRRARLSTNDLVAAMGREERRVRLHQGHGVEFVDLGRDTMMAHEHAALGRPEVDGDLATPQARGG